MRDNADLPQCQRGTGRLSVEQQERALAMIEAGLTSGAVARAFGVTRNVIAGIRARHGGTPKTTMDERLDALHERLDAVLAATLGVGRIPESERKPR